MSKPSLAFLHIFAAVGFGALASPASAELPQPVRAMVEAAIATGDPGKVDTVIAIARQTNPDGVAELDAMKASFDDAQRERAASQAAEREHRIRTAGLLGNWSGRGEVGASRSTGNTSNVGLALGLRLERKGIDWQHLITASADFQRSNGRTTSEKYVASWEPRYNLGKRAFAFAISQFERNPFQGYDGRYSVSGGIGYRLFDGSDLRLSLKAGPAWRKTEFTNGASEGSIAALAGFDFDWAITDRLKFTQDMNMLANAAGSGAVMIDANNTSINLASGLEAKVSDRLTTRFSYVIDYDSNPPFGAVETDTFSRVTLVYGF